MLTSLFAFLALAQSQPQPQAQTAPQPAPAPAPSLAPASTAADPVAEDWHAIPDDELLVMTLSGDRRIVIRLAPRYAPAHIDNIRKLATQRWWDGESVYRVQDNYVVQWGNPDDKPQPGIVARPPAEYEREGWDGVTVLSRRDPYAARAGYSADGWPLASDGRTSWMPHCYGMVGVARGLAPETGSGSDLYTVIGHAPRHLDRNIALVGRIVEGIEHLTVLPRGTGNLGFYEDAAQRVRIDSVRLASDIATGERPRFQYRATDNPRFTAWVKTRENREPPFFTVPAGGADICNALPPVRKTP